MRFLIKFSYDGSKYNGYQKQPRKRTIQRELEKALKEINANKKVLVSSSGRTDKGVHAYNQYAHFDLKLCIFNFFNFDLKIMYIANENQILFAKKNLIAFS